MLEQVENVVTLDCKADAIVAYLCPVRSRIIKSAWGVEKPRADQVLRWVSETGTVGARLNRES